MSGVCASTGLGCDDATCALHDSALDFTNWPLICAKPAEESNGPTSGEIIL